MGSYRSVLVGTLCHHTDTLQRLHWQEGRWTGYGTVAINQGRNDLRPDLRQQKGAQETCSGDTYRVEFPRTWQPDSMI